MLKKKYVVLSLLGIVSVFLGSLFYHNMVEAQETWEYDNWYDINDDGIIDIQDIYTVALRFGTMGTPINKQLYSLNF